MVDGSETDNNTNATSDQPLLNDQEPQTTWDNLGRLDSWEQVPLGVLPLDLEECALEEFRELKKRYDALTHALRKGRDQSDKQAYSEKYEAMRKLMSIWTNITPQKFVVTVTILGKDCKDYLKLLSFPMLDDDWLVDATVLSSQLRFTPGVTGEEPQEWQWLKRKRLEKAQRVFEYFPDKLEQFPAMEADDCQIESFPDYETLREWNEAMLSGSPNEADVSKTCCFSNLLAFLSKPAKVMHAVHWTCATRLLYNVSSDTQVRMVNALKECGDDSEAFNTLISRMIAKKAWDAENLHYIRKLFQDALYIVFLGCLTFYIMWLEKNPHWCLRWLVMAFAGRALCTPILELGLLIYQYRGLGLPVYFTFWNIFIVGSEIISAVAIFSLMYNNSSSQDIVCDYRHTHALDECQAVKHPVKFSIAILLKWIHFLFEMMCLPGFGQTVLPAFYAVFDRDTLWFSLLLMFILIGSFQSYWSLPIPDNMPKAGVSHLLNTFFKIFRLDILGEADMFGLEGREEEFVLHIDNHSFTGGLHAGAESPLYHDAIGILSFGLLTVVSILTMNVTIGIVGEAYVYNKSNKTQVWCHYRSSYNIKLLMRRSIWCLKPSGYYAKDFDHPEVSEGKGVFIGFHEAYFLDVSDTQECLQDMIDQEKEITAELVDLAKEHERLERWEEELSAQQQQQKQAPNGPRPDDDADHAAVSCGKFLFSK